MNELNLFDQILIFSAAYIIKPAHMILSLYLIVKLFYSNSKDLILIRTGVIIFLIGEIGCALNYLFLGKANLIFEIVHDFGMIGLGTFISWAVFEFWEKRILKVSEKEKNCSFQKICKSCWKYDDITCKLNSFIKLVIIMLIGVCFIPLLSTESEVTQLVCVLDSIVEYKESSSLLFIQYKVYSTTAIFLLITSLIILQKTKSVSNYNFPLFSGIGFLFYSLMSFFLVEAFYKTIYMATVWEEATELMIIILIFGFLKIFNLFPNNKLISKI